MHRPALLLVLALSSVGTMACGAGSRHGNGANSADDAPIQPAKIGDAQFAAATYQLLLSDEKSPERTNVLAGVVRWQLARAGARFNTGKRDAGLQAVKGAIYLTRVGELRKEMLVGGAPALRPAAAEVSRVGNEGRAFALYGMLKSILPPSAEQKDVDGHLAALARWTASTGTKGPMQNAGAIQTAMVNRAMFEPSEKAVNAARDATITWIKRALDYNAEESPVQSGFDRDEAIEAYRAVRAGGLTVAALYLRFGDAKGALDAFDRADLLKVVPPALIERLERCSEDDDPQAWADLYQLFSSADQAERPETSLDVELGNAAAWGTAVELFRSEPRSLRGAGALANELARYGMAEVAPLVLAPALGANPSAQDLSWALSLVLRATLGEDDIGDHASARRTFAGASPRLPLAEQKRLVGKVRPTPARLHYVMGALETRSGDLARARPHIQAAVKAEPSLDAFSMLAAIDRQRGDSKNALSSLGHMVQLARKGGDFTSEAEAFVLEFEIHRDAGNAANAKKALDSALDRALKARESARNGNEQAQAERVLARVLEHFGAAQGAKRATDRAFDASRTDSRQLTATVLDASRRALTHGDLQTARQAVRQALDAALPAEDLIYVAIWLKLVEMKAGVAGDGTAEEAFASIDDDSGWPARLAAWGRGKIDDDALIKSARTRPQQTEAKFYAAMTRRMKGQAEAMRQLKEIAKSEAIELVEVTIARDLVAQEAPLGVKLPDNVSVP
jgi:tetratricopeptide (TPR) repeat protein